MAHDHGDAWRAAYTAVRDELLDRGYDPVPAQLYEWVWQHWQTALPDGLEDRARVVRALVGKWLREHAMTEQTEGSKSKRADKRGHWQAGVPRHETRGVAALLRRLERRIASHPGTIAAIEQELGIGRKTLWRWRKQIDIPAPDRVAALTEWLDAQR